MKEKPVILYPWEIAPTLGGAKTQFRRVVKPQPEEGTDCPYHVGSGANRVARKCPYGVPGDRLWVRETWCHYQPILRRNTHDGRSFSEISDGSAAYKADGFSTIEDCRKHLKLMHGMGCEAIEIKNDCWRPSIHMPRWASRITLEVKAVRVERVQDIRDCDAISEGLSVGVCEGVFCEAAGKALEPSPPCWFEDEDTGELLYYGKHSNSVFCESCADKIAKEHPDWDYRQYYGGAMEDDGPAFCGICSRSLQMSLTEYGVNSELFLEDDDDMRPHWPACGDSARILEQLAGGIGYLEEKHHGRLAQIGFATLWDKINAKRGYSWEANPWVFVVEFERLGAK